MENTIGKAYSSDRKPIYDNKDDNIHKSKTLE